MILHTDYETMPREDLEALQLKRLKATVDRCYHTVKFYRDAMDELEIKPHHIKTITDVQLLPYTKKEHLRQNYPFGLFAVPTDQVVRIHASSGTTGKPTVVGYTKRDIQTWAQLVARCLASSGMRPGDRLHNGYGYGLFTGGLGLHYGGEELGVMVTPMSGGQTPGSYFAGCGQHYTELDAPVAHHAGVGCLSRSVGFLEVVDHQIAKRSGAVENFNRYLETGHHFLQAGLKLTIPGCRRVFDQQWFSRVKRLFSRYIMWFEAVKEMQPDDVVPGLLQ